MCDVPAGVEEGLSRALMEELGQGMPFAVRYVGSLPIATPMKSLDFAVRTAIAKECINRVCRAANFLPPRQGRERGGENVGVGALLGPGEASLRWSGKDVTLTVSGESLSVSVGSEGRLLFSHPMPAISFASGGDEEAADFVCYVGKSSDEGRRCIVFESGLAQAPSLLAAIGHAFKYRLYALQRHGVLASERSPEPLPRPAPPALAPASSALSAQPWYHGPMSRQDAETLLAKDGDFLVRESGQGPGQYVLSGLEGGTAKHLLLIDTDGKVRTKDREFPSVTHLIDYHRANAMPITSAESALMLRFPILASQSSLLS